MCAKGTATLGACLYRPEQPGGRRREAAGAANNSAGAPKARGCKGRALTRPLRGGGSGAAEGMQASANATNSIPSHISAYKQPKHPTLRPMTAAGPQKECRRLPTQHTSIPSCITAHKQPKHPTLRPMTAAGPQKECRRLPTQHTSSSFNISHVSTYKQPKHPTLQPMTAAGLQADAGRGVPPALPGIRPHEIKPLILRNPVIGARAARPQHRLRA